MFKWTRYSQDMVRLSYNDHPIAYIGLHDNGWYARVKDGKNERTFGPSFRLNTVQREVEEWAKTLSIVKERTSETD